MDLTKLTIIEAKKKLDSGEITAESLVMAYIDKIKVENPDLNAYLEIFSDAIDEAKKIDEKRKAGEPVGELAGIPLAIKDNILIHGKTASSSSKLLENYTASYDATVIKKLKSAGAIFLGRTNMDEFAMGGSTENSAFGPTKNPHDKTRVPGGSSGGSAAAVGGDLAIAALGTDTGGSIREPSSFCGTVGLKPTYGAVSRFGAMAMASSLDQIGPITKTVEDAELLFNIIKGKDDNDATSIDLPVEKNVPAKLKIGVPREFVAEGLDGEVAKNFADTLDKLKAEGHEIVDIELPSFKYALGCYYIIMPAEVSTNLARFDGLRYGNYKSGDDLLGDYLETRGRGFGPESRRRIMLGTYVLSAGYYDAFYDKAVKVKQLIKEDYKKAFAIADVIVTPTAPTPAFKLGEKTDDPLSMYLADIFTVPVNLAGVPAISVPTGKSSENLPLGIQITAPWAGENLLFSLGRDIENLN